MKVDLRTLKHGTEIYVINGAWYGKVVERNGKKCLWIKATGEMVVLSGNEDLDVEIHDPTNHILNDLHRAMMCLKQVEEDIIKTYKEVKHV